MRKDLLDPLPYTDEFPSLMSSSGRIDAHSVIAHYLADNCLSGAYLEFGVGRGRSAVSAIRAYTRAGVCNQFHLFDSFEGLPQLEEVDKGSLQFHKNDFSFSEEQVTTFLKEHEVWDENRVRMHKGWFDITVSNWVAKAVQEELQVAVVHLDMDLYHSCVAVLNNIAPLLRTGVVMIFDDWNCFAASNHAGERRAVKEWLLLNRHINLNAWFPYGWHGQVFFCDIENNAEATE